MVHLRAKMIICNVLKFIYMLLVMIGLGQVIYNGPASNAYFQSEFKQTVANLPELKCGSVYQGETNNQANRVNYYRVEITSQMKDAYKSIFKLSSCCEFDGCGSYTGDFYCNADLWVERTGNWNYTHCDFSCCCSQESCCFINKNYGKFRKYCNQVSLDTVLYLLYEKK
eukprot:244468_1